jgi:hypothetical protein
MTTDSIPRDGWHAETGALAGSRRYTSNDHPGWEIYDAGRGGVLTVYRGGMTATTRPTLAEAISYVETVEPESAREQFLAPVQKAAVEGLAEILAGGPLLSSKAEPVTPDPALVTAEVAFRLSQLAISVLGRYGEVDHAELTRRAARAQTILSHLSGEMQTQLGDVPIKDLMSGPVHEAAAARIAEIMAKIDPPLKFTSIPDDFTEESGGVSDRDQRAFRVPGGGLAVFTRISTDGRVEVEYSDDKVELLYQATPDEAMAALLRLLKRAGDES